MTITQLLKFVNYGNTAVRMFDQKQHERTIYIEVGESKLGYFDSPVDFEIAMRNEYLFEFAIKVIKAQLIPNEREYGSVMSYSAFDPETGEVLARVEMYDKN